MEDKTKVQQPVNNCTAPAEPGEEWRIITNEKLRPNTYWISSHGRVWSTIYNKFLGIQITPAGYPSIHIQTIYGHPNFFLIHQLVAAAFLDKPEGENLVIDHIDGNPLNSHPTNLRWCTQLENIHNSNTMPKTVAACRAVAAMKAHAIKCEGFDEPFPSANDLAKFLGVSAGMVRQACVSGKPVGARRGWNNGKGLHVEYQMNDFDARSSAPVTLADAIEAAKLKDIYKDNYPGTPVLCIEDNLPFPSVSAAAKAYRMTIPALITNRQRTDSGVSNQPDKKGFRITHHFKSLSKEDYIAWVRQNAPEILES